MSIAHQPLDLETENPVTSLILQDLQEIQDAQKGKGRVDAPITDDQLALQDQLTAVMSHMTLLEDLRLAHSLDDALRFDGHYLEALSIVNQAESEDHDAALALQRGDPLPAPTECQRSLGDPFILASLCVSSIIIQYLINQMFRNLTKHATEASTVGSSSNHDEADAFVTFVEFSSRPSTSHRYA
jgi:hypothetical protein